MYFLKIIVILFKRKREWVGKEEDGKGEEGSDRGRKRRRDDRKGEERKEANRFAGSLPNFCDNTGPGLSQEQRIKSISPTWMAGTQVLG